MKKKIIVLSSVAICAVLIVIGATFAHFTSKDSVTNVFNTGSINAVPEEVVDGTNKRVWVKNTGDNDCLVRVSITPRWVDSNGNPWAGDVNKVNLKFENIIEVPSTSEGLEANKWVNGGDGFYYYTSKLAVYTEDNKIVTSDLLSKVTLEDSISSDYDGKTLKVDVKVEAVQANRIKNSDNTYEYPFKSTWRNITDNITTMLEGLCQ